MYTHHCLRNCVMLGLEEFTLPELLVILGTIGLLGLLLAEVFDWTHIFTAYESKICNYGYHIWNGPATWKERFPNSRGDRQSPINICTSYTICIPSETMPALKFSQEYYKPPKELKLQNDGHNAVIYACWENDARPTITGGPFTESEKYQLYSVVFRWGPTDDEGSEHTIDSIRYAMEVQATHTIVDSKCENIISAAENNGVLIVSYLYQATPLDNPFLESIVSSLKNIRCPFEKMLLEPLPLSWIIPPFASKYFAYQGSLTHPPCTEGVKWLIQPEPLSISSAQIKKFRKLLSISGPLTINTRPVQELNQREVYFYD